jgi:hypothetical protein
MKTTASIDAARLELLLTELRLPTFKLMWKKLAEQSDKEGWPTARFLAALAEHEVADRSRRRIEPHLAEALHIIREAQPRSDKPEVDFVEVVGPIQSGPCRPFASQCSPCCQGGLSPAIGTGDRFCRQVGSGKATPSLWGPKARAGPVGRIGCRGARARRSLSSVAPQA